MHRVSARTLRICSWRLQDMICTWYVRDTWYPRGVQSIIRTARAKKTTYCPYLFFSLEQVHFLLVMRRFILTAAQHSRETMPPITEVRRTSKHAYVDLWARAPRVRDPFSARAGILPTLACAVGYWPLLALGLVLNVNVHASDAGRF